MFSRLTVAIAMTFAASIFLAPPSKFFAQSVAAFLFGLLELLLFGLFYGHGLCKTHGLGVLLLQFGFDAQSLCSSVGLLNYSKQ